MSQNLASSAYRVRIAAFSMAVLVITISLIKSTSFLDSINWPKQIALVSIAPILVILAIQGSFELTRRASIQLSLLGICIAIHFIYFFFEGPPSHQKIWGQLDSSNGAITIASLLLCLCIMPPKLLSSFCTSIRFLRLSASRLG